MRKKLSLELDQLQVDSFATSPREPEQRGTVHGNEEPTVDDYTCGYTCGGETCADCSRYVGTCYPWGTCGGPNYPCYDIEPTPSNIDFC